MYTTHQKISPWRIFPYIMVRCAGLPYSWLLELQARETVEIARRVIVLEEKLQGRLRPLLAWIDMQRQRATEPLLVNKCRRAERNVKRLRPLPDSDYPGEWQEQILDWNEFASERERLLNKGTAVFQRESEASEQVLARHAGSEVFQEGVFLNSPDALAGVRHFLTQQNRSGRRLVTRYLQRFCAKNDTASFFGPINYARLAPRMAGSLSLLVEGDGRAAKRQTRMSHWAVQAIADAWARDPAFAPALRLYRNARRKISANDPNLGPIDHELLAHADGHMAIMAVAETLSESWEHIAAHMTRLAQADYLHSGLLLPAYCPDPLEVLENILDTMPADIPIEGASDQLSYWKNWLAAFETSSLQERERLLSEGEAYFSKITGQAARRQAGYFEVDRMIFNEEAVGNITDFQIGDRLEQDLVEQLSLALDLLASQAIMIRQRQHQYVKERLKISSEAPVPVLDHTEADRAAREEYTLRWTALIGNPSVRTMTLTRDQLKQGGLLRDDLNEWPLYCAPDVMIMANSIEAIEQGDFTLVLAEVHHILPPTQLPFLTFHPRAEEMKAEALQELRALVAPARPTLTAIKRQNKAVDLVPLDHALICLDWVRREPGAEAIALADVVSSLDERGDPQLRAVGDDTPLALFPDYLDARPDPYFLQPWALPALDKQALSFGAHMPRIVVEKVIYQRESWELEARDLALPGASTNSFAEFMALWRWKIAYGMPDQVFVWLPGEVKPTLLDFLSIPSCEAYLHHQQHAERAYFTEMLPTPNDLWLEIDKKRYCCELRMTLFRERISHS